MKYNDLIDKGKALQEKIEDIETGDDFIVLNVISLDMNYEIIKIFTYHTKTNIICCAQYKYACKGYVYEVGTYQSLLNIGDYEEYE